MLNTAFIFQGCSMKYIHICMILTGLTNWWNSIRSITLPSFYDFLFFPYNFLARKSHCCGWHFREMLKSRPLKMVLKINFSDGCGCQFVSIDFPINFQVNMRTLNFCSQFNFLFHDKMLACSYAKPETEVFLYASGLLNKNVISVIVRFFLSIVIVVS